LVCTVLSCWPFIIVIFFIHLHWSILFDFLIEQFSLVGLLFLDDNDTLVLIRQVHYRVVCNWVLLFLATIVINFLIIIIFLQVV
jgi:hypothetical protein